MPELMRLLPDKPVYRTANGVKSLKGHYHQGWNFQVVKTGDTLSLGNKTLQFMILPNLHWPDTMYTYVKEDKLLFTCDSFGAHFSYEGVLRSKLTGKDEADY